MKFNKLNAFTLLELLLVIAIIAVLAGLIIYNLRPADILRNTNLTKRKSDVASIEKGLRSFQVENNGSSPTSFNNIDSGTYDLCRFGIDQNTNACLSLDELVPLYLSEIPLDPYDSTPTLTGYKLKYERDQYQIDILAQTNSGFTKALGTANYDEVYSVASYNNNYFVITKILTNYVLNKLDSDGNILFSKTINNLSGDISKMVIDNNGFIYIASNLPIKTINIYKFDSELNPIWAKNYENNYGAVYDSLTDLQPSKYGGFWVVGHGGNISSRAIELKKMDDLGNIERSVSIYAFSGFYLWSGNNVVNLSEVGPNEVIISSPHDRNYLNAAENILILRYSLDTGLVWAKNYSNGGTNSILDAEGDITGFYVGAHTDAEGGALDPLVFKVDFNGNLVWSNITKSPYNEAEYMYDIVTGGGKVFTFSESTPFSYTGEAQQESIFFSSINSNTGALIRSKIIDTSGTDYPGMVGTSVVTDEGGVFFAAQSNGVGSGSHDAYLVKLDSNYMINDCANVTDPNVVISSIGSLADVFDYMETWDYLVEEGDLMQTVTDNTQLTFTDYVGISLQNQCIV